MVDQILESSPHCTVRLALVGYVDYDCQEAPLLDFTEDLQAFQAALDSIKLGYGRDLAEDVFSGLQAAGQLTWRSGTRVLVHVGDYPCHGQEFHDLGAGADDYLGGDKLGRDAGVLLHQLAVGCKLDSYVFSHLAPRTHKMIQRFRELLGAHLLA